MAPARVAPRPSTECYSLGVAKTDGVCVKILGDLRIKLFADGADKAQILQLHRNPLVRGFTTNPTLMRAAGVKDYQSFALDVLEAVKERTILFEGVAVEFANMVG